MNYTTGIVGGAVLGGVGYVVGEKVGYFKSLGVVKYIFASTAVCAGGNLGFTAVALSQYNPMGLALSINILTIQACILSLPIFQNNR